jgi:hypothetical protein
MKNNIWIVWVVCILTIFGLGMLTDHEFLGIKILKTNIIDVSTNSGYGQEKLSNENIYLKGLTAQQAALIDSLYKSATNIDYSFWIWTQTGNIMKAQVGPLYDTHKIVPYWISTAAIVFGPGAWLDGSGLLAGGYLGYQQDWWQIQLQYGYGSWTNQMIGLTVGAKVDI